MSVDTQATLARLQEAETAYHQLMMGQNVTELRDHNGEMVRYTPANAARLLTYIQTLRAQLGRPFTGYPGRATF